METPTELSSTFISEEGKLIYITDRATYTITGSGEGGENDDKKTVFFKGDAIS